MNRVSGTFMILIICISFYCSGDRTQVTNTAAERPDYGRKKDSVVISSNCRYNNLSDQFDILVSFNRIWKAALNSDSCFLVLRLKDKQSAIELGVIKWATDYYHHAVFAHCDSVCSYSTKINHNRAIMDNYFGDLVVADLNFDGLDDVAFINDSGGNGGPLYSYYLQTGDREFLIDQFLCDSVSYFPHTIDPKKQRLTTFVHAGACCMGEHVYQYNKQSSTWKQIRHIIHDVTNEK